MTSKARLTVWDEDTLETVATVELMPRAVQGAFDSGESVTGEGNLLGITLETRYLDETGPEVEVLPEWVGKKLNIQIAPSAIDDLEPDFKRMATRWKATVA